MSNSRSWLARVLTRFFRGADDGASEILRETRSAANQVSNETQALMADLDEARERATREGHGTVLGALVHDMRKRQQREIARRGE